MKKSKQEKNNINCKINRSPFHIILVISTIFIFTHNANPNTNHLPERSFYSIQKSYGIVEFRTENLDGSLSYKITNGFLVDKKSRLIVTSAHIFPNYRSVIEESDAIHFYSILNDQEVKKLPVYVYAVSRVDDIVILQLENAPPEYMDEVVFTEDISLHQPVYALIHEDDSQRKRITSSSMPVPLPFDGHVAQIVHRAENQQGPTGEREPSIYLDASAAFFGAMVVDDLGRVVGMGNGTRHGQTVLTNARTIQTALAAARHAEQQILQRDGVTPLQTRTIKKLANVFEEIMLFYASEALERPHRLQDCAYEMFAMRFSGKCRDVFSAFVAPAQAQQKRQWFEGKVGDIGLEVVLRKGKVEVVTPFNDMPAARVGIKPGDVLRAVDGNEVHSIAEANRLFHGAPGTQVDLSLWRQDEEGVFEQRQVTVVREIMPIQTVTTQIVSETDATPVGILRIQRFHENTAEQFRHALDEMHTRGIDRVVIDVRNNPGGSFLAAVRMLALFMRSEDTVVVLRGRNTEHRLDLKTLRAQYDVHDFGRFRGLHMVILINHGSASAAEIFAGVLQDWGYPVVGEVSFGKGVAQSPMSLSDTSMLILTTFEFLLGNRQLSIRGTGVQPNMVVAASPSPEDRQLSQAITLVSAMGKTQLAQHALPLKLEASP